MGRPPDLELIPICLGTHEAIPDCDGDSAATDKTALPCSWRERCMGFQQHLDDTGKDEEQFIEIVPITSRVMKETTGWKRKAVPVNRTHDEFSKFCTGLAKLYGITRLPKRRPVEPDDEEPETRERKPRASSGRKRRTHHSASKDVEKQATIKRLITHFCVQLRQKMDRKLNLDKRGQSLILPGMLYLKDRRAKSGYVSVYCRKVNRDAYGRDAAVAAVTPRYKTTTLNISLPVDIRKVQKALGPTASMLTIEPDNGGAFKTIIKGLDSDGLETVAGLIAGLAEQGILELPPR